jgi:hypothetical protein
MAAIRDGCNLNPPPCNLNSIPDSVVLSTPAMVVAALSVSFLSVCLSVSLFTYVGLSLSLSLPLSLSRGGGAGGAAGGRGGRRGT